MMRATVTRVSDVVLVCLSGRIEIEKSKALKRVLMKDYKETKMVFCLKELSFVGSYGLTLFMQVLQDLNKENLCTIKISGATRDIQFLMDSCEVIFPKFQTIDQALKAFMAEANPSFPG
jgi:anti-anti-sigma factor